MAALVDEAMHAGALGFSTSRTLLHRVPDGRAVPGTWAEPEELYAVRRRARPARPGRVRERQPSRRGRQRRSRRALAPSSAWMGEVSRRSGRPVSFGLAQTYRRHDLYRRVIEFAKEENALGAELRPQTTARGVGPAVRHRVPHAVRPIARRGGHSARCATAASSWRCATRHRRCQLIAEAEDHPPPIPLDEIWVLPPNGLGPIRLPGRGHPRRARRSSRRVAGGGLHRAPARDQR